MWDAHSESTTTKILKLEELHRSHPAWQFSDLSHHQNHVGAWGRQSNNRNSRTNDSESLEEALGLSLWRTSPDVFAAACVGTFGAAGLPDTSNCVILVLYTSKEAPGGSSLSSSGRTHFSLYDCPLGRCVCRPVSTQLRGALLTALPDCDDVKDSPE